MKCTCAAHKHIPPPPGITRQITQINQHTRTMKIAYLIFAYKNPILIKRTIDHLSCNNASFFVHIDSKFPLEQFQEIKNERVHFIERIPVYWAEFSGVQATLLLIRAALAAGESYDYFILLSGSEFPLRSREYIHQFMELNRGREFITMSKMPAPGKPLSRINTLRFPSNRPILRFLFRALAKFGLAQRDYKKHLGDLEPYSGITWWALSKEACEYIIAFTERDEILARFCANIHAPEETFIHTILGNSPLKARARRNLVYEDWPTSGPRHGPKMLTTQNVEFFESRNEVSVEDLHGPGELLFARKLSDETLDLVDRIKRMIQDKEGHIKPLTEFRQ